MSKKEILEFSEKLKRGLELAEKRMLEEKALKGEDVVICSDDDTIQFVPANQVIASNVIFQ